MRVSAISGFMVPKFKMRPIKQNPLPKNIKNDTVSFSGSLISKYVKLYKTLPDDIKAQLTVEQGINMLRDMERVRSEKTKRSVIGEGSISKVFENPWLKGQYNTLILTDVPDKTKPIEVIYSTEPIGKVSWVSKDDSTIQLISVA